MQWFPCNCTGKKKKTYSKNQHQISIHSLIKKYWSATTLKTPTEEAIEIINSYSKLLVENPAFIYWPTKPIKHYFTQSKHDRQQRPDWIRLGSEATTTIICWRQNFSVDLLWYYFYEWCHLWLDWNIHIVTLPATWHLFLEHFCDNKIPIVTHLLAQKVAILHVSVGCAKSLLRSYQWWCWQSVTVQASEALGGWYYGSILRWQVIKRWLAQL